MEQLVYKIGTLRNPILIDVKEFNNQKLIDIRKYFIDKDDTDKLIPTKKGISLNSFQLEQLIETLNINAKTVSDFFQVKENRQIDIEIKPTIGRSFQCKYENNKTSVIIDEKLNERLSSENLLLFTKMVEALNIALLDVLEQEDEKELIMDVFNQRISRML
jgi:hypothetical protein